MAEQPAISGEVILLFSVEDLEKAKEFAALDDLRQAMQKTSVTGNSDDYCLKPPTSLRNQAAVCGREFA